MVENVDQLLETSSGEYTLEKTSFSLSKLISDCVLNFESLFERKNIKLNFINNIKHSADIFADEDKINSLLNNLVSNAFKYSDENTKVFIILDSDKIDYIISVKDFGIGIEENELEMIFENLYRVEKSRVKDVDGFGIGLSICKNIVMAHGGNISVSSKIGTGSEFVVKLPKL